VYGGIQSEVLEDLSCPVPLWNFQRGYPTPGVLYEYQKKGDAEKEVCKNMKTKGRVGGQCARM
jgi:hypothetical protein